MRENGTHFAALIIVVLAVLAAAQLLLVALVLWLTTIFGSIITPCLLLGLVMALLGFVVYRLSLRAIIQEMHERIGVIYGVTKALHEAVEWAIRWFFPSR